MNNRLHLLLTLLVISLSLFGCGRRDSAEASGADQSASEAAQPAAAKAAISAGDASAGQEHFTQTCIACHGPTGEGVPNLGKDMTTSEFIAGKTDAELVDFLKVGRDTSDPLNTTSVAMPPKGGNPALSDDDLVDIVAFIRTLLK